MKHTAQIENGKWIVKNEKGETVTEFSTNSVMQNIVEVLEGLDAGKHPANVLFPGIFEEN